MSLLKLVFNAAQYVLSLVAAAGVMALVRLYTPACRQNVVPPTFASIIS